MEALHFTAFLILVTNVWVSLLWLYVAKAGASGKLSLDRGVGIKLPSTKRSPEAWKAGHQAAIKPSKVVVVVSFVSAFVGAVILVFFWGSLVGAIISQVIGIVVLLLVSIWPSVCASKAANAVAVSGAARSRNVGRNSRNRNAARR